MSFSLIINSVSCINSVSYLKFVKMVLKFTVVLLVVLAMSLKVSVFRDSAYVTSSHFAATRLIAHKHFLGLLMLKLKHY